MSHDVLPFQTLDNRLQNKVDIDNTNGLLPSFLAFFIDTDSFFL